MFYIGSILLSLAVVQIVMAAVLLTFWQMRTNAPGLREMAGAMAISSLGAVLTGIGAAKADVYFGFVGFQCFVIGVLLAARSMRRLQGITPLYVMEAVAFTLCLTGDAYFLFIENRISGVLSLNSLTYSIVCGITAWHLIKETRADLKSGCRLLGIMFAAFAAMSLVRAVVRYFIDIPAPTNVEVISFDLLYVLTSIAVSLGWSLGFLWTSYSVAEFRLRAANEKLHRFSSAVAHDLNTPLNAIIGYLEALDHLPETAQNRKAAFIMNAHEAALRMNGFIHQLLEQSRTEQAAPTLEITNLETCIHEALKPLQSRIEEIDAEVRIDVTHHAMANAFEMTRVFQNLLDNAFKYRAESCRLCIDISSKKSDSWVHLSVTDNGLGISMADQTKIFQQFNRAETATAIPGYGLGLSSCRHIVESLGGAIEVDSQPGVGSTFILKLVAAQT